jgi:hypothetical protein
MTEYVLGYCQCESGEYPAYFVSFSDGETFYECSHCSGAIQFFNDCLGG